METIKLGSKGNAVKSLQQALNLTIDGDFGPKTEKAVKEFQVKNHLTADGIVGNNTWNTLCCSSYIICDGDNKEKGINVAPKVISFSMMKRDNKVGCLTAVYDIKLLGKKYFMPTIRKRQDWALFLSIIKDCKKAYGIQEPLAYYRLRGNSVSSNKFSLIKYNLMVYRQILGFNGVKSALYFTILFPRRSSCSTFFVPRKNGSIINVGVTK